MMDFDLDDLISNDAANNAKANTKFQPKPKPKPKSKPKPEPEPKSTQFVEAVATAADNELIDRNKDEQLVNDVNRISENINDDWQSSFEKSQNAESFLTMESLDEFLCESATVIGEGIADVDPLTGEEAVIFNDNEHFQIGNLSSGSKDAEIPPFWESIDIMSQTTTCSGPRVGKFKPKPKIQTRKTETIANNPDQDVGPTQYEENINSVNENGRSSKRLRTRSTKTIEEVIDEPDDDGIRDEFVHENEDTITNINDDNDDYVPENEALISKKSSNENKKTVRKRKKASEVPDESTKVVKRKFAHCTRRNKRQVNPELLKIPEDELEFHMHNIPMKELIRLAEHRERIAKKEASTSGTPAINQSGNSFSNHYDEDEAYEHDYSMEAENATYYNYRTHMKITPRVKWSKQDTQLFYEAVQQFGTDLSMIKECFPGRTREQIKSKYKKEERQQPLRLNDALTIRAKGHSHFEVVIERLKQAQAQDSENDDQINLTGEEDDEVAATNINEASADATKPVLLEKQVKEMERESLTKSCDSEDDDMYRWSQYKSEI